MGSLHSAPAWRHRLLLSSISVTAQRETPVLISAVGWVPIGILGTAV
jgi:hypothetical protein